MVQWILSKRRKRLILRLPGALAGPPGTVPVHPRYERVILADSQLTVTRIGEWR
jgi:hypothetical protein